MSIPLPQLLSIALLFLTFSSFQCSPTFPSQPNYSAKFYIEGLPLPQPYQLNITQRIRGDDSIMKWRFDVNEKQGTEDSQLSVHVFEMKNATLAPQGVFAVFQPAEKPLKQGVCYVLPVDLGIASLDLLKDFRLAGATFESQQEGLNLWKLAFGMGEVYTSTNPDNQEIPKRASIMNEVDLQWTDFQESGYDLQYFEYDFTQCQEIGLGEQQPLKNIFNMKAPGAVLSQLPKFVLQMISRGE